MGQRFWLNEIHKLFPCAVQHRAHRNRKRPRTRTGINCFREFTISVGYENEYAYDKGDSSLEGYRN